MNDYQIVYRLPTIEEYQDISTSVGWTGELDLQVLTLSLKRSVFSVVVEHQNQAIGMGRIVGDGYLYFYLQDISVKEEFQQHGLGELIVQSLLTYVETHTHEKSFVGLFTTSNVIPFYQKNDFHLTREVNGMYQFFQRAKK